MTLPVTAQAPRLRPARAVPAWWQDAAGAATWSSALVVAALWLHGRGLQNLSAGTGTALTSAGRLAGLVAADLLLVQVLLMARVPLLERAYGQDELARRHRLVGFWSFNLLLAHIALITLGYATAARAGLPHEAGALLGYSGVLLAAAGTALLVLVTMTSVRAARRRLRYGRWHLLHLYSYAGIGLTIPHQLWTGADFNASPVARAYWWAAYALAAAAVLVYRVGVPIARSLRHGVTVRSVVRETPDVVTVHLTGRHLHRLRAQAGQFFLWRFLDGRPGWSEAHPYSLSSAPGRGGLRITVKEAGDATERLAGMRPGTRVLLEGPFGRLTPERFTRDSVVMLACGIGITPLYALLEDLPYAPGRAVLVYRARSGHDLALKSDIASLARRRGVTVHYLLGPRVAARDSWLPASTEGWTDAMALLHFAPNLVDSDVFVCGPDRWMDAVVRAARDAGLPEDHLHQERFAW